MADEAVKQFTTLLDNSILGRLERMRIASRRRLTNRAHGEHLSGKGGTSIEFSDFRDYVAGDDLRFVDWNIFSRLNRPVREAVPLRRADVHRDHYRRLDLDGV